MNEILQWVAIICTATFVAYLLVVETLHYRITKESVELLKIHDDVLKAAIKRPAPDSREVAP